MKRKMLIWIWVLGILVLGLLGAAVGTKWFRKYEEPKYEVLQSWGAVELRHYGPRAVAETRVRGTAKEAGYQGFRILVAYISGKNAGAEKISMTAPVTQEAPAGEKISMTAPVTQQADSEGFVIRFMMPSSYTLDSLPKPLDPRISLRELPARRVAAIRYSGSWSQRNYQKHLDELLRVLDAQGHRPAGEPVWARYDPPFVPWFLKRNEIFVELD
jgi:DNA gyrase inhibitor GyrI